MTRSENNQESSAGSVLMEGNDREAVRLAGQLLTPTEGVDLVDLYDDDNIIEVDGPQNDDTTTDGPKSDVMKKDEPRSDGIWSSKNRTGDVVDSAPPHGATPFFAQSFSYKMFHPERGCFLIFNQEVFDSCLRIEPREEAKKEAHMMYHTAKSMGYEYIQIFNDCTKSDIFDWLSAVSKASHSVYDSFGCAFLTHCDEDGALCARDATFNFSECAAFFTKRNCPTLAGKPKIFFIQADRIEKRSAGKHRKSPVKTIAPEIPSLSDFAVVCSTAPRFSSTQQLKTLNSSFFAEAVYRCFSKFSKTLELMQILCRVNRFVAHRFETHSVEANHLPSVTSQLTAEVYLYKPVLGRTSQQCAMCNSKKESRGSKAANAIDEQPGTSRHVNGEEKQPLKRQKSLSKWIRKSLRKKK